MSPSHPHAASDPKVVMREGGQGDRPRGERASARFSRLFQIHPILVVVILMLAAVALTHVVPAGSFQHGASGSVASSYRVLPKVNGARALFATSVPNPSKSPAQAAGVVSLFAVVPAGMVKSAPLIFMVMFVGGMFGVLRATGAVDAGSIASCISLRGTSIYSLRDS